MTIDKGLFVLLSRTWAGPGRTVKQDQEEISLNHVQAFIPDSAHFDAIIVMELLVFYPRLYN